MPGIHNTANGRQREIGEFCVGIPLKMAASCLLCLNRGEERGKDADGGDEKCDLCWLLGLLTCEVEAR